MDDEMCEDDKQTDKPKRYTAKDVSPDEQAWDPFKESFRPKKSDVK